MLYLTSLEIINLAFSIAGRILEIALAIMLFMFLAISSVRFLYKI